MNWQTAIDKIQLLDVNVMKEAETHLDQLTKPQGSLGMLEDLAIQLAGIYQTTRFRVDPITSFVFVGDHGVTEEGVSAFPSEVTTQMVHNFLHGGAAINVLTRQHDVSLKVVDVGMKDSIDNPLLIQKKIGQGTRNFLKEKAMTKQEAIEAIQVGFDLGVMEVENGAKGLAIGEMGIGNTTSSAAIAASLLKRPLDEVVGRGTGLNSDQWLHKKKVIQQALQFHNLHSNDPIEVLATFGGYEIAAMTGMILSAAYKRVPILLDGFNTGASALIAAKIETKSVLYMIASHQSEEPGHRHTLQALQIYPLLQLNLRLGEGTGAILALPILRSAQHLFQEMATFEEANVANKIVSQN
ncbi:nicotinate-nucleotide--dimethylbenzimidazole phosphoribosyltransferase [Tepidibacillus decaturensis]|uniref:Nicotinate-nucleotide--dimethylbenzimidazole phosphoribosyltransferase n=1 Tax=Tepidibacillus decaturensis TaxID=1413211 RepID=A0A135L5S2_9BACI|nr:nicotinate-nucleotide--dimethylbenzimidazole phosphoribosyltransferase [Tepidibacillus decaturensis]KXG44332.1 hypothetical protein U473_10170 [Tepidibacillus decaturensis]